MSELDEIVLFNNFKICASVFHDEYYVAESLLNTLKEGIPGDVVELGCYVGESSKILRRTLDYFGSDKELYVYDSFQGLPEANRKKGDGFKAGDLSTSRKKIIANFKKNNLRLPIITKTWFEELTPDLLPDRVCYAFFDGDMYSSIRASFKHVWPILSTGGVIAVHDYHNKALLGVSMATNEFLENKPHRRLNSVYVPGGHDILILKKI